MASKVDLGVLLELIQPMLLTFFCIDPRYFRPTEVETLWGDPTKAKELLGWRPRITFSQLVTEMVHSDLEEAKRDALLRRNGYQTLDYCE